jgi:hypothetical protein
MNLPFIILKVLSLSDGYLMPKETLVAEVRMRDRRHTHAEIEGAMRALEDAGQITGVSNADAPGGSRWQIADAGRVRVAEAGI